MATQSDQEQATQSQNLELRKALNDAYAFVEGNKFTQSASALTFEDLLDQQIERLSGADSSDRPNELNRIDRVLNGVIQAVAQIKSMPDNAFLDPNTDTDVNTPR